MTRVPLAIPRDHPAYAGHFPGTPILPAVVLLAEVMAQVAIATGSEPRAWCVTQAKFTQAVLPGTPLELAHETTAPGRVRFEVRSPEGGVAEGQLARAEGP